MSSHDHSHAHSHGGPAHGGSFRSHFGAERAAQYDAQMKTWFIGGEALHEATATVLTALLAGRDTASLLCVGVGTGQDLIPYVRHGAPGWRFTGVDPSADMLEVARTRVADLGLKARTHLHVGTLDSLPEGPLFDGAEMIGVLHHVPDEEGRLALLREVKRRLQPGAPFVFGCRVGVDPVLTAVEEHRLRWAGAPIEFGRNMAEAFARQNLPESEAAIAALLARAGFEPPRQFFAAMQFRVYLTRSAS